MKAKIKLIAALLIWGSMGVIVRQIHLPAGEIALFRGVIGLLFLMTVSFIIKKPVSKAELLNHKWILLASGIALGANWIFLFEAYQHTTIAIATLSYYLAPIIIALLSAFLLKEKLTFIKGVCCLTALTGLAFVSGVLEPTGQGTGDGLGILYGIAAAISYASLTLMNKFIKGLSSIHATIVQFGISSVVLIPYTLLHHSLDNITDWKTLILLIILGVFHAGLAFWLFFSAVQDLKAQTIAVFSYIDPATAVLLSAFILNEKISFIQIIGAFIILGSAFISEIFGRNLKNSRIS